MFSEKDILTRLQNGEDAQAIADEFAKVINAANKTYADQKAKEEEERKAQEKANKEKAAKTKELQSILNDLKAWFVHYYDINETDIDISAEEIIQMADGIVGLSDSFSAVFGMKPGKPAVKVATKTVKADPDATINAFLKSVGW